MAQDPDAIKVAGLYETRGRRSKSQKARTLTETLKGFEATAKGLTRSLDFALPIGLFAFAAWTSKVRIKAVVGETTIGLYSPDRTMSVTARPTYQGRGIVEIHFDFPDLYAAEGMGMLTILMSMPGSDIIGLVENGLALAIYHVFLNGGDLNVPGAVSASSILTVSGSTNFAVALGLFLAGVAATGTTSPGRMHFTGLFQTAKWTLVEMQENLQKAIDAGKMTLPTPVVGRATDVPLEPLVRRVQVDSVIKSLAHSAFLTMLLKRGGGVVPTE